MILLNDFQRQWKDTGERVLAAVAAVGESGWYVLGSRVQQFEEALAGIWRLPHAIGVANGMEAIEIALTALGCGPGDKVLTTPLSAFATTLAILRVGATPVFVDTDSFGLINLDFCRSTLSSRPDIRYFLPVHLYGNSLDMRALAEIRDRFEIKIVEDCAQSILSTFDGVPAGTAGALAATSFYPTKNLGGLGDGGAILTADLALKQECSTLRDYGQTEKYKHEKVGWNSRLDELQAAILGEVFLPCLAVWTARRRAIALRYLNEIRNPAVSCIGSCRPSESSWHLFPVQVEPNLKGNFIGWLRFHEVGCGEHYPVPIHHQNALQDRAFEVAGDCSTAEHICASEVSLPIHPYLTDEEIEKVIDTTNNWRP